MTPKQILALEESGHFRDSAHDSIKQVRKYTGIPYKNHPRQVRETVLAYGGTLVQAIVADLHDVLEDVFPLNPYFSQQRIADSFGATVLSGVVSLTNVFTREAYPAWNRAKRHQADSERLGKIEPEFMTVKLADIYCNVGDIVVEDPKFAKYHLLEKREEIKHLALGDGALWIAVVERIEKGLRSLQ